MALLGLSLKRAELVTMALAAVLIAGLAVLAGRTRTGIAWKATVTAPDMAESFGVEGRGRFYEEAGTLRDVVQNHLLQVISMLAMEPPIGPEVA